MLDKIITFCLKHRLLIIILIFIILCLGIYSAVTLSTDAFPDVSGIQVEIISKLPGKTPPEMEKFVTYPIEIAMRGLPGLKLMRSVSKSGISVITVVFDDRINIYFARQQILERLIEVKESLPEGTDTVLGPISTAMGEIYIYTIEDNTGQNSVPEKERLSKLRTLQDWVIAPYLKNIPGVNEIDPFGGYIKQYQIVIKPEKLIMYGFSLREIYDAVMRNNSNVGGNFIEHGAEQYLIRGEGLFQSPGDIGNITLKCKDGARILLSDVASVTEGEAVRQGAAIKDGKGEVVGASVLMLMGSNSRNVVKAVKDKVKKLNESGILPCGITIKPYYDRSEIVSEASLTLGKALIEGIILIIIILYFFLRNLRGAWVIISALLLSVLGSAVIMRYTGITANLMTLGGLIISLAMIIDSAIIQTENVERHLTLVNENTDSGGSDRFSTVLKAVLEVRKPSILGELIIAITFLPILALEGLEGKMFSPLAIVVFIALMISLLLSIFVIPVICFYLLKAEKEGENRIVRKIKEYYLKVLRLSLKKPGTVIIIAISLLLISVICIPFLGTEFMPVMEEGAFDMDTTILPGASLSQSLMINRKIQEIVKRFPELETVVSRIGWSGIGIAARDMDSGTCAGKLRPRKTWKNARTREELVEKMREALTAVPGAMISFSQPIQCRIDELVAGTKSQIVVKLFGDDLKIIRQKADELGEIISGVRGTKDLMIEQVAGQEYVNIKSDRLKMSQYGINVSDIQDIIEIAIGGKVAGKFYEGNKSFDILLRFDENSRNDIESIKNMLVDVPGQKFRIPLNQIAEITLAEGPVQISRENGERKIMLQCNVFGRDIGGYVSECKKLIKEKIKLPNGYYIEWGGQFENQQKAFKKLSIIIPVTIGVIFILLFLTFDSIPLAFMVMLTLPFALIGGVLSLMLSGSYLSVPASIGFIALFGIAVLNGVVLISYINQLKEEGLDIEKAILEGCSIRLRPILMTASIAIISLIPLLFSTGPGSEVQRPLAIVVAGGLLTSTLMSIIVLPVLYKRYMK